MGSKHSFIDDFNPYIVLCSEEYKSAIDIFDAGLDNFSFNEFIKKEADEYKNIGDGVTYLVFNKQNNESDEIVAYFTLCSGAIPYVERWKVPKEEQEEKSSIVGVKALYLRSVPNAEIFYKKNGFDYVLKPMNPFYCIDDDYKAMYIPFVQTKIHYD